MKRTRIAQIFREQEAFSNQQVQVGGWVRTLRDMKTFGFIELNDGSCFKNVQVVLVAEQLDCYKEIMRQMPR